MNECTLPAGGPIGESVPEGHTHPTPTPLVSEATLMDRSKKFRIGFRLNIGLMK